jgi:5-methylcytosine-specific restriction enzyme A
MPIAPKQFKPSWVKTTQQVEKKPERHKLYNHQWAKQRKHFLYDNQFCVFCLKDGKHTVADVVDHITPHKGDETLFWDISNWQPLCKFHHDSTKKKIENRVGAGLK